MRKIFLLANLCLASGLTAPRILFAESGLVFDQTQGTLTGQLNVTSNVAAAGSVTASSATLTNTAGAGLIVSSSAYLAISGGNVGIGTAGPNYKLDITGSQIGSETAPSPLAVIYKRYNDVAVDNRGAGPSLVFSHGLTSSASGKSAAMSSPSEDSAGYSRSVGLGFWTSATDANRAEVMRISGSGSVGIGTTTPNAKLQVTDSVSNLRFGHGLSAGSGGPSLMLETASNVYGDILWNTVSADQVRLRGSSYGLAIGGTNPRLNIGYADANYTSAALVVNGNVGIGTTAPTAKLAVGVSAYSPNLSGKMAEFSSGGGWGYITISNGNTANSAIAIGGASGITSFNRVTDAGVLSESMRIDSTGNVGIGTASPYTTLSVGSSDATAFITPGGENTHLSLQTVGAGGAIRFYTIGGTTNNVAPTESMRITPDGNVGIGTASPLASQKLDVAGAIRATTALNITGYGGFFNGVNKFGIDVNASASRFYASGPNSTTRGSYQFHVTDSVGTLDTIAVAIDPSGSVGIGTASPAEKLEVSGGIKLGSNIQTSAGTIRWSGTAFEGYNGSSWVPLNGSYTNDSSALWTLNGSNIYRLSGNVGIGTVSPANKLTVYGAGDQRIMVANDGTASAVFEAKAGTNSSYLYTNAAGDLRMYPNAQSGITILGANGNIGIGTVSPGSQLVATKGGNTFTWVDVGPYLSVSDGTRTIGMGPLAGGGWAGSISNDGFGFRTNNTVKMFIDATGNVGIGTLSPFSLLDVSKANTNTAFDAAGANRFITITNTDTATNNNVSMLAFMGLTSGGGGIRGPFVGAQFYNRGASTLQGDLVFGTDNNGTSAYTERMRITSAGNVGIGTANPTARLHIGGTAGVDGIKFPDGTLMTSAGAGSASNLASTVDAVVNADSDANASGAVRLQAGGSDKLTILNGGNVGIGTTGPVTRLQVKGNNAGSSLLSGNVSSLVVQNAYTTTGNTGPSIQFKSDDRGYNSFAVIGGNMDGADASGAYGSLVFGTKATAGATEVTERMRINKDGNVGVGTANPARGRLVVGADTASGGGISLTKADGSSNTSDIERPGNSASGFAFKVDGDPKMTILTSGNVGIGSANPPSKLFIYNNKASDVAAGATNVALNVEETVAGVRSAIRLAAVSSGGTGGNMGMMMFSAGANGTAGDNRLSFGAEAQDTLREDLVILGSGNVGIGTTNPAYSLDVNGYIHAAGTAQFLIDAGGSIVYMGNFGQGGSSLSYGFSKSGIIQFAITYSNGNATLQGTLTQNSDRRIKTDILPLTAANGLAAILRLNPVSYTRLDGSIGEIQLGFIAQDVEKVFPELVTLTGNTTVALANGSTTTISDTKSLNYIGLIPPSVKAIQELDQRTRFVSSAMGTLTAMWVGSSGNVGIGTASPQAKLAVAGDMYANNAGSGVIVKSPDGTKCARIGIDNSSAQTFTVIDCP